MKKKTPEFKVWIKMLASRNVPLHEEAFHYHLLHVDELTGPLINEFKNSDDENLQVLLLELMAYARTPESINVLAGQLWSDNPHLREWAINGLKGFHTIKATQQLVNAQYYELATPEATEELHEELNQVLGPEQAWEKFLRNI